MGLALLAHGSSIKTSLLELSAATFVIGAPLIHLLHDRRTNALASSGLRLALPVIGGFLGNKLHSDSNCGHANDGGGMSVGLTGLF